MDKIIFRFSLLQVRFPGLYQEAQEKLAGGVARKDIIADWLKELEFRRSELNDVLPALSETNPDNLDFNAALDIMDSLD